MRILVSNDDGYQSPGLHMLANYLEKIGTVQVVVPDRDRSGASNSLTLNRPVRAITLDNGFICVEGTPTDCVHLALTGLLAQEPDVIIAGLNPGPNMGDDVIYSGTVAAATEGRFLGLPSIAISINAHHPRYWETAARIAVELTQGLATANLAADTILNVNVPDLPYAELAGMQATRLGHRHKAEPMVRQLDPRGREVFWVGPAGSEQDAGPGTDFYALRHNYVSVTPLQIDLTRHRLIPELNAWLANLPSQHPQL